MARLSFYKPALIVIDGVRLSDHARQGMTIDAERIEEAKRMANGTMRKYIVATKHSFSTSWDLLPHSSDYTVDGFAGAKDLQRMYETKPGAVQMILVTGQLAKSGDNAYIHQGRSYKADTYNVFFSSFSLEVAKRGNKYDMYNVNIGMEEA